MAGKVRSLTISEGITLAGAPTLDPLTAGSLGVFADDAAYVTDKGSAAAAGDLYSNSTDGTIHHYDGSAWQSIVDLETLDIHTGDTSNPHSVTQAQVGLSDVDNTSDADKPISSATQSALDAKADDADLTSHTGDTANPHSVTQTQVGLSNVDNTSDVDKPVSVAQQSALDAKIDDNTMTTRGDILHRDASNSTARLPLGTTGQVLTTDGTDISWGNPSAGLTDPMTTRGDIIVRDATNITSRLAIGTEGQILRPDASGDTVWEDGVVSSSKNGLQPKISDGTFDAAVGEIGEELSNFVQNFTLNTTLGAKASIPLTAGVWDVEGMVSFVGNLGLGNNQNTVGRIALSTTAGGLTFDGSAAYYAVSHAYTAANPTMGGSGFVRYRFIVTSTTTLFLNLGLEVGSLSSGNQCRMRAVRVR